MTDPTKYLPSDADDDVVLTHEAMAGMSLPITQAPAIPQPLPPGTPADDPGLDDRLIVPRARGETATFAALDDAAYQPSPATDEVDMQEEEAPRYFLVRQQHVSLGKIPHTRPVRMVDGKAPPISMAVPLAASTREGIEACAEEGNPRSVDELWLSVLDRSLRSLPQSTEAQDALSRVESEWSNRVLNEADAPLVMHRLRSNETPDTELRAEKASMAARTWLDMGTIVNVPLWHSGIWLTIRDPGDMALQEALRKQLTERIRVGRDSHSMGFSSFMVYTLETLVELILSNVTARSVHADIKTANLIDHISVLDFPTLVWGLASAVYPNGFEYSRACTSGAEKCTHIVHENLNLNTCLFVDKKKLTSEQLKHMSNMGKGWAKAEDLKRYRDQFTLNLGYQKPIKAGNGKEAVLNMKIPTIAEAIDNGHIWLDTISNFVTQALGLDASNEERQTYQRDLALTTEAGQFTQWISQIVIGGLIKDPATLRNVFYHDISTDDVLLENLKLAIAEFSTKAIVSTIGVLNYTCPACKRPQMVAEGDDPVNPNQDMPLTIAIDPTATFFELMYRKFLAIRARA